jgi:hypothetical protein
MTVYRILYRGSLSSCNYSCDYCPFAKTANTRAERQQDARELERFVGWVERVKHPLGILFTPWGEAIVRGHYRQALVRLSHLPQVRRVALQTNLSSGLADFAAADRDTLALWATFHPTQVALDRFIERCEQLQSLQIRFSVGVVGLREHFAAIQELRLRLPASVYLWINSYKREPDYYTDDDLDLLRGVDPYFDLNRYYYASRGKACRAGQTVFTVDGQGSVRRCHFIDEPIGNIYESDIFASLHPRPCTNATCGCHIGYVHRPELHLDQLFADNVLERIPATWPDVDPAFVRSESVAVRFPLPIAGHALRDSNR